MEIISHRYLIEGKNKAVENTLSQLKSALKFFNFFETDIRRLPTGEFYISHDPQNSLTPENDAGAHAKLWKDSQCKIALNIKELGYEKDLVEFLKRYGVIENVFLFDFDIEFLGAEPQSYIENIHRLHPALACAVRVSHHGQTVDRALGIKDAPIIWLDEFDGFWAKENDIKILKQAGRIVYCVSPDLHDSSKDQMLKRWQDFIGFGVDGICTDYPALDNKYVLPRLVVCTGQDFLS